MPGLAVQTDRYAPMPSDLRHLLDQLIDEVLDDQVHAPGTAHLSEMRSLVAEIVVNTLDRLAAAHDLGWEYAAARYAIPSAGVQTYARSAR